MAPSGSATSIVGIDAIRSINTPPACRPLPLGLTPYPARRHDAVGSARRRCQGKRPCADPRGCRASALHDQPKRPLM